jgi:protein-S-isoprenylcysteine O-methyltransferase Ste14
VSRDQAYGAGIFIVALVIAIVYLIAFFAPWLPLNIPNAEQWREWAIALPLFLLVLAALVITMWIGWTMLSTPPPLPLEEEKLEETKPMPEPPIEEKPKPRRAPRRRRRRKK